MILVGEEWLDRPVYVHSPPCATNILQLRASSTALITNVPLEEHPKADYRNAFLANFMLSPVF